VRVRNVRRTETGHTGFEIWGRTELGGTAAWSCVRCMVERVDEGERERGSGKWRRRVERARRLGRWVPALLVHR
jgi:hypothetical protein